MAYRAKVTFTFDDGNDDLFTNAYPIMKQYGLIGTANVITNLVGTNGHITYNQLITLFQSGWEIASHSTDTLKLTDVTPTEAYNKIANSKATLETNITGLTVKTLAAPDRAWNSSLSALAQQAGYIDVRSASNASNITQQYPISNLFDVQNISPSYSSLTYSFAAKDWIDKAISEGSLLVLLFHHIQNVSDTMSVSLSDLDRICAYAADQKQKGLIEVGAFCDTLIGDATAIHSRRLTPVRFINSVRNNSAKLQ